MLGYRIEGVFILAFLIGAAADFLAPLVLQRGHQTFAVKQVPGDGACLFNALAEVLRFRRTGVHCSFDTTSSALSGWLRATAVSTLMTPNKMLLLEDGAELTTDALVDMVAQHYNMSGSEYCDRMKDGETWGGGPEIVALSNYLCMPVHVYELVSEGWRWLPLCSSFRLRPCALFGSPAFDKQPPLCILCCDGRYPHIFPGQQRQVGDHFLALFPMPARSRPGLRGHFLSFPLLRPWDFFLRRQESVESPALEIEDRGFGDDKALEAAVDFILAAGS